jgi:hypothetical protein
VDEKCSLTSSYQQKKHTTVVEATSVDNMDFSQSHHHQVNQEQPRCREAIALHCLEKEASTLPQPMTGFNITSGLLPVTMTSAMMSSQLLSATTLALPPLAPPSGWPSSKLPRHQNIEPCNQPSLLPQWEDLPVLQHYDAHLGDAFDSSTTASVISTHETPSSNIVEPSVSRTTITAVESNAVHHIGDNLLSVVERVSFRSTPLSNSSNLAHSEKLLNTPQPLQKMNE